MKDRIGVDFDGTVVKWLPGSFGEYDPSKYGDSIPEMVERMRQWMAQGFEVVIFTARVHPSHEVEADIARVAIQKWCRDTFGCELEVTCMKDPHMVQIWDDKAVSVEQDTGRIMMVQEILHEDEPDAIGSLL